MIKSLLAFLCVFASLRFKLPLLILALAVVLRIHALTADVRFHPDEALFSTFARSAALNGAWLLPGALDKPPLSIYASALSMTLFATERNGVLDLSPRVGEIAARLPNMLASLLLVAVIYRLARALYPGESTALWAMLLMTLSPYAVAFSATAFTDSLMLLGITATLWASARGRWFTAGVCLALACASKQQAILLLPLVLALGWGRGYLSWRAILRIALPFAALIGLFALWESARAQPSTVWTLAAMNNDPWRLIRSNELLPRLSHWLHYAGFLLSAPPLTAALLGWGIIMTIIRSILVGTRFVASAPITMNHVPTISTPLDKADLNLASSNFSSASLRLGGSNFFTQSSVLSPQSSLSDLLILTYALGYFLLHWLIAFNTYDRYLLPLLPLVVLLAARGLSAITDAINRVPTPSPLVFPLRLCVFAVPILLFSLPTAWVASEGHAPIGGDRGEHDGIIALADMLNAQPLGAIIYDHWLGWELGYYLGEWTDKRRVYYPTPANLAQGAAAQPDPAPRYFPVPADVAVTRWLEALRRAGFQITEAYRTQRFVVYRLIPLGAGA